MDRKPIFDAVRQQLGRGFTSAEVASLDRAIDQALHGADRASAVGRGTPAAQNPAPAGRKPATVANASAANASAVNASAATIPPAARCANREPRHTGPRGIALIKQFEGFARLRPDGLIEAYPDPATGGEPWTIGHGSTGPDPFHGGRIRQGTIWTREQAETRFAQHLAEFEQALCAMLGEGGPTSQNQFDAMISLVFNVGPARFSGSTLLRLHRAGDHAGAAGQFGRWNRAAGRVMAGLTRRREAEAALYRAVP